MNGRGFTELKLRGLEDKVIGVQVQILKELSYDWCQLKLVLMHTYAGKNSLPNSNFQASKS